MIFTSDNWSGASERVIAALAEAARDGGPAYGNDDISKRVEKSFAAEGVEFPAGSFVFYRSGFVVSAQRVHPGRVRR